MLAQILIELRKVSDHIDGRAPHSHLNQELAQDYARVTQHMVTAAGAIRHVYSWLHDDDPDTKDASYQSALNAMASSVCTTIAMMLHFTQDESETGARICDAVQGMVRTVVRESRDAKVKALRESEPSQDAQRAFRDSLGI